MGGLIGTIAGALTGAASSGPNKTTEVNVSCCSTEVIPSMEEEVIEEEDSEDDAASPRRHVRIRRSNASTGSLGSYHSHRSTGSSHR